MKIRALFFLFSALFTAAVSCENQTEKGETNLLPEGDSIYLDKGRLIASSTFAALSGKLQAALGEGGVPNAVEYCKLAAYPLVDSLSKAHQAGIRRTSLRVRNPQNAPNEAETAVLKAYEQTLSEGGTPQPMARAVDESTVAFYAPIQISAFCLQCHGKVGETLREEDYALIRKLYPADKAVGYAEGDLRGIWSIQFKRGE